MIANPVPWPNGARCAVAFTFDMDADSILHLAHHTSADTRLAAMSMLRYGPEIAVPRLVELYKRFGMHQTFFLPAWCMERYPAAVDVILQGGHEIAHHGYLHEHPNELRRVAERDCSRSAP
jgi:peptidoglycan-N-acetylglucosamine deacetylase